MGRRSDPMRSWRVDHGLLPVLRVSFSGSTLRPPSPGDGVEVKGPTGVGFPFHEREGLSDV